MMNDTAGIKGTVEWELIDSVTGEVKAKGQTSNLVTQIGDQCYAERGAGIASPPAIPTGMKLGTGSTTPAKTGAGAALVTYLTGSQQAFDGSYPASALNGSARRITYQVTYAAGTATTGSAITEVVIVNETLANSTSLAAATIARALITGVPSKGASDILRVTWNHDLLGA